MKKIFRDPKFYLVTFFFFLFSLVSIIEHTHFRTYGDDLGIFDQAIWHYSLFQTPVSTVRGLSNILGDHFHPILILLAPMYWIFHTPVNLLVAQAFLLAITIIPIYLIAKKELGGTFYAVAFAIIYGIFWGIQETIGFDFHEIAFAVPLIAFSIYYIRENKPKIYIPLLVLLIFVKEDMTILLCFFAFYLATFKRYRQSIAIFLLGFSSFIVITKWVIPFFAGTRGFRYWHYTEFGNNIFSASINILLKPIHFFKVLFSPLKKFITEFFTFLPFIFLPFLSTTFILAIPLLLERFLSTESAYWGFHGHYSATVTPILVISTIDAIAFLEKKKILKFKKYIVLIILLINVGSIVVFPFNQIFSIQNYYLTKNLSTGYQALRLIPQNASVIAQNPIVPHLSERNNIYILKPDMVYPSGIEYILASSNVGLWPYTSFSQIQKYLNSEQKDGYKMIFSEDGWYVLKRK